MKKLKNKFKKIYSDKSWKGRKWRRYSEEKKEDNKKQTDEWKAKQKKKVT